MAAIRNFAITLCVSLIIFGLLAYFLVGIAENNIDFLSGADTGDDTSETTAAETKDSETGATVETTAVEYEPLPDDFKGSTIAAVLIGSDYQPNVYDDYDLTEVNKKIVGFPIKERQITADSIIYVQINLDTREYVFCSIPSDTLVEDKGIDKTIGSLLGQSGAAYIKDKVSALLGIYIDYYAMFNMDALKSFIDGLGGISYNVPWDLSYSDPSEGKDGLTINIAKGTQKLTGEQAVDMLRYVSYTSGDASRRAVIIEFMKTVLVKLTDSSQLGNLPKLFTNALGAGSIETNFTEDALATNLDAVFAYPDFTKTTLTLPGTETNVGDDKYFSPNYTAIANLFSKYKYTG
jgi:cell envelope-related function transcriptional attenuator common domain